VDAARRFSNTDLEFITSCIGNFIRYYGVASRPQYRDWTTSGEGLDFGVVDYVLPADARVAVVGDWGTGLADAEAMLTALIRRAKPIALIHLGDVYYSGTEEETQHNFVAAIDRCCAAAHMTRPPVFTIPGNHDYYSGGVGFYDSIDQLNTGDQRQQASYFCLRTEDGWQFLGLDTGRNDHVPGVAFEPFYRAPHLEATEVQWARHKLSKSGDGKTILLTHHQLFSARSALNGPLSFREQYCNWDLKHALEDLFPKVAMWLWGHEHSLALFEAGLMVLNKGRLLGCSAFELPVGDGYDPRFKEIGYDEPTVKLGMENQWLNHGCAVIDMGDKVVDYYQFPSWGDAVPADADLSPLASEYIEGGRITIRDRDAS
jgi:predicted phosphodiesterase